MHTAPPLLRRELLPGIAGVLQEEDDPAPPADHAPHHADQLGGGEGGGGDLGQPDGAGVAEEAQVDQDVGEVHPDEHPEEAETEPGALHPDGEEQGGQGHQVHHLHQLPHNRPHRVQFEAEAKKVFSPNKPKEEVEEEEDPKREVNDEGLIPLPGSALLHVSEHGDSHPLALRLCIGVPDVDDLGEHIGQEHEDHEDPPAQGLPGRHALSPLLHLSRECAWSMETVIIGTV